LKSVLLYLLLVGLPLLGIVGVLHFGERLKPPAFVGGTWSIQVSREAADLGSCGDLTTRLAGATLTVSQSGSSLTLTLGNEPKIVLTGEINDLSVVAESLHQSADEAPVADDSDAVQLQAQVGPRGRLQGVIKLAHCAALRGLPFTASRLSP